MDECRESFKIFSLKPSDDSSPFETREYYLNILGGVGQVLAARMNVQKQCCQPLAYEMTDNTNNYKRVLK